MGMRQSWGLFQPHMIRDLGITAADFSFALAIQNIVWSAGICIGLALSGSASSILLPLYVEGRAGTGDRGDDYVAVRCRNVKCSPDCA
jgi:hypothetical protein